MNWIESVRHDISELPSTDIALKKFGLTVGGVMIALAIAAVWKHWWSETAVMSVLLSGLILCAWGMIAPRSLRTVHRVWMSFAIIMGSIVSRIILSIIFFLILTPVALAARMAGKRFLPGLQKNTPGSLWIQRDRTKQIDYERMS
ncbi:MAG: SxtJ family membrane protein [Bacteroidota bacterium]